MKFTIVLPVKIKCHRESDIIRIKKILFPSLQKNLNIKDISSFIIISPDDDYESVKKELLFYENIFPFTFYRDSEILPTGLKNK